MDVRSSIIQKIYGTVKRHMPPFNDYLLKRWRQDQIADIPATIDWYFREMLDKDHIKGLKYLGYAQVEPYEAGSHILNKDKYANVDINLTTATLYRYDFEAQVRHRVSIDTEKVVTELGSVHFWIPYLHEQAIALSGSRYYPIFNIMENSMIKRRSKASEYFFDTLIFSTSIIPVNIFHEKGGTRNKVFQLTSSTGVKITDHITKIQTHKNKSKVPIILYPLVRYGLVRVLGKLGFTKETLFITTEPSEDQNFLSFELPKLGWINVHQSCVYRNSTQRRALIAISHLLTDVIQASNVQTLLSPNTLLWRDMLGTYIHPTEDRPEETSSQVKEHLLTADRFIGADERLSLSYSNLTVKDFYDFCLQIFEKIEFLLQNLDPRDLFNKRLVFKAQFFKPLIEVINTAIFDYGASNNLLRAKEFKDLLYKFRSDMLIGSLTAMDNTFKPASEVCHDNWLLNIGAASYRSALLRRVSNKKNIPSRGKKHVAPKSDPAYAANPSQFAVTSPLTLPSNPIVSGSINVYVRTTEDGRFIPHDDYNDHLDIFDV